MFCELYLLPHVVYFKFQFSFFLVHFFQHFFKLVVFGVHLDRIFHLFCELFLYPCFFLQDGAFQGILISLSPNFNEFLLGFEEVVFVCHKLLILKVLELIFYDLARRYNAILYFCDQILNVSLRVQLFLALTIGQLSAFEAHCFLHHFY